MSDMTAGRCWELLIAFYEKQKGVKAGYFSNVGEPMFGVKPPQKMTDEIVFNSNWLDEIEEMVVSEIKHAGSYTCNQFQSYHEVKEEWICSYNIFHDRFLKIAMFSVNAPTRNLARARCLCKVVDSLEGK